MKKFSTLFSLVIAFVIVVSSSIFASADFNSEEITQSLSTANYYMMSLDDGLEVFSKNETAHVQPAAMNKVLAAAVAVEKWGNLDDVITLSTENLSLTPSDYSARKSGFSAGDTYTKLQLIQAMLVYSANDAEAVIAYEISGSTDAFAKEMNSYAASIGCTDTNVISIFGFDEEGQYISPKDVALIISNAMKNSNFADTIQASSVTLPASTHTSEKTYSTATTPTYSASPYYHPAVKGGKETSTTEAGKCIAVVTNLDGYSYIAVSMNGTVDESGLNTANKDVQTMVKWAYENLNIKTILEGGQVVKDLPISGGKNTDKLQLCPKDAVSSLVLSNVSSGSVLVELEAGANDLNLKAPIQQGDYICKANVLYANEVIATVDLVAASTVQLSTPRLILEKLSSFMSSGFVIFIEVVALLVLLFLLAMYLKNIFVGEKATLSLVGGEEKESTPMGKALTKFDVITEKIKSKFYSVTDKVKNKKGK